MTDYITYPLEADSTTILETAYDFLRVQFPGWEPADGNLDAVLAEAYAAVAGDLTNLASAVPDTIFRWFGASLIGIPPVDAAAASVASTWTATDTNGHIIEAGTLVGVRDIIGELHSFEVLFNVTIAPGASATAAGGVTLVATDKGEQASGLGSPGYATELITPLSWVSTVLLTGATSGGVDAETDVSYLDRLARELRLMTPRPILPNDFAVLARRIAGVYRAVAIDGYNPVSTTYSNERMVAVSVVDANGNAVIGTVKTQVDAYLQAMREINFIVNVIDPSYTTVDVNYTFKALPDYTPASVITTVNSAITTYLSPVNWGTSDDDNTNWRQIPVVRITELIALIDRQSGVDYVGAVTIRTGAAAFAANDLTLSGAAPLPRPGVITGTSL